MRLFMRHNQPSASAVNSSSPQGEGSGVGSVFCCCCCWSLPTPQRSQTFKFGRLVKEDLWKCVAWWLVLLVTSNRASEGHAPMGYIAGWIQSVGHRHCRGSCASYWKKPLRSTKQNICDHEEVREVGVCLWLVSLCHLVLNQWHDLCILLCL